MLVEPQIQEEQFDFHPGRGTLDQLYNSTVQEGIFPTSPHVLC